MRKSKSNSVRKKALRAARSAAMAASLGLGMMACDGGRPIGDGGGGDGEVADVRVDATRDGSRDGLRDAQRDAGDCTGQLPGESFQDFWDRCCVDEWRPGCPAVGPLHPPAMVG